MDKNFRALLRTINSTMEHYKREMVLPIRDSSVMVRNTVVESINSKDRSNIKANLLTMNFTAKEN
jgi:hypothetical protein